VEKRCGLVKFIEKPDANGPFTVTYYRYLTPGRLMIIVPVRLHHIIAPWGEVSETGHCEWTIMTLPFDCNEHKLCYWHYIHAWISIFF
jgi:hypothetical protein